MTRLVLGIDTSGMVNVGLAAVSVQGTTPEPPDHRVLTARTVADSRAHVEQLMPLIRDCLADAGRELRHVELIVVGMGPGPFTGLRVGIVTAEVLGVALAVPIHRICSLDVLAAQHVAAAPAVEAESGGLAAAATATGQRHLGPPGTTADEARDEFLVATDARRREVYWARYDATGRRIGGPGVSPPADVPRLPTIGPAVDLYPDQLLAAPGPRSLDPGLLAELGPGLPEVGSEPLYLRRADASEPTRPKSVLLHHPRRVRG